MDKSKNEKSVRLFLAITGASILLLLITMTSVTKNTPINVSESPLYKASHTIIFDELGEAPYSDNIYLKNKTTGKEEIIFTGYCRRFENDMKLTWLESNILKIQCEVTECGVVKKLLKFDSAIIQYQLNNYDPVKQHQQSESCNP